jgi:hypothetical protein
VEQRVFEVEAEFRLLTIYVHGMKVDASQELKFIVPISLDEALNTATVLHSAKINKEDVENYFGLKLLQMLSIPPSVRSIQSNTSAAGIGRAQWPF